jgi:hypothetical protein
MLLAGSANALARIFMIRLPPTRSHAHPRVGTFKSARLGQWRLLDHEMARTMSLAGRARLPLRPTLAGPA